MKRLILVLVIALAGVWHGVQAVGVVQVGVLQRDTVISEALRK